MEDYSFHSAVFADYLDRICEEFENDTLLLGFLYLDVLGRHFVARTAVYNVYLLRAEPNGCSASVHGGISAADHGTAPADIGLFSDRNIVEKVDSAENALRVLAAAPERRTFPRAVGDKNRVMTGANFIERDIFSYAGIRLKFNTKTEYVVYLSVKHRLRQTILGDSVAEHSPGFFVFIVHGDAVSAKTQPVSSR